MKLILILSIATMCTIFSACAVDSPDQPFVEDRQLSAIDITTNALTLRWQPSTIRSSSPILYRAYYSLANNLYSINATEQLGTSANPPITTTTCRITGLDYGTLYYFNVVAIGNGQKSLHAPFAIYTAETNAPIAGSYLRTRMATKDSIRLLWSKGSDLTTPVEELSYKIYYSTNDNLTNVAATITNGTAGSEWLLNKTNHTVTGLEHSKNYYFRVLVKDKWGNIGQSDSTVRATADSNNNFIINGNFSAGSDNWGYNYSPFQAGIGFGGNRIYCYSDSGGTGASQAYALQNRLWYEGDAAYAQFTIGPSIPSGIIGFCYLKIQFKSNGSIVKTYQNEMHTANQYSGIIWMQTPPAPQNTTGIRVQLGFFKISGIGQVIMTADNVSLSVVTNQQ